MGVALLGGVLAVAAVVVGVPPVEVAAQQVTPCDQGNKTYAKVSRAPRYDFLPQEVVSVPSVRDGAAIQIGLVRPKVPEGVRVPVIVDAGPYYHPMQTLDLRACQPRLTENFAPQGYAVALLAVRGTGDSGGCMDMMGPGERADLDQAITWLGTRPWSSGAVGMVGKSYDGSTPWEVASFGNPHLKTIVPASGVNDLFALLFGPGTPDWRGPLILNDVYYAQSAVFYLPGRSPQNTAGVIACPDYGIGNLASVYSAQTGELDPFGYWAARRYRAEIERNYRGSIFLIQGLQDWNVNPGVQFPWVTRLDRAGLRVKYLLGQWGHNNPDDAPAAHRRLDYADQLLDWFDHWLKGRNVDLGPAVQVEDSDGRWRTAPAWPPRREPTTLWLTAYGGLATAPDDRSGSAVLVPDPAHTQGGYTSIDPPEPLPASCPVPTCVRFATAAYPHGLRFAGLPRLRLTVTPSGPAGQLSAYLYAADDSGSKRLGWGQVDLRFPTGQVGEPSSVEPGRPMTVDFTLQPLDAVIQPGQRLVLVLSEGTTYNRLPSIPNAPMSLHLGGRDGSLSITQDYPAPATFFDPGGSQ